MKFFGPDNFTNNKSSSEENTGDYSNGKPITGMFETEYIIVMVRTYCLLINKYYYRVSSKFGVWQGIIMVSSCRYYNRVLITGFGNRAHRYSGARHNIDRCRGKETC